jgi:AcrR family transcriptional regulator
VKEVHTLTVADDPAREPAPRPTGRREQHRIDRTRQFLGTALDIVTTEGFDALTMQRLADQCDSAIGAVYRYFPSKGALVAEVQREAIERISTSYALVRAKSDASIAGLGERPRSLARLVLMGRWFIALGETHPQELRLFQMLMSEWRHVVPVEEGFRVVPSVMRLLDEARDCIEAAADAGSLDGRADPMTRVVVWAAGVGGVMQAGRLDIYDAELFDGARLASVLTFDLFASWGATRDELDVASEVVDSLELEGT